MNDESKPSRDEGASLLEDIKTLKLLGQWAVGIGGVAGAVWITVLVSDHFLLQSTAKELDAMKPRVETLWWHSPYAENAK